MEKLEMPMLYTLICDSNLDDVVNALTKAKNDTINFYYDFYDHRLYSDSITLEDAYEEIYNMTREEYQKMIKETMDKYLSEGNTVIGNTDEEKLINFDRYLTTRGLVDHNIVKMHK
jgi:hypothetical protein